jgi:diaminobutyrate-2-oxoglutarate transaminase
VIKSHLPDGYVTVRGIGLIWGLAFERSHHASLVAHEAFRRGLLVETAGKDRSVVKILPPLTINNAALLHGLAILSSAIQAVFAANKK